MANLTSSSIVDGGTIEASHITALYDVLTGATTYDNIDIAGSASNAVSASYASTSNFATSAGTASLATTATLATSASHAVTASYAENAGGSDTGSLLTTASVSSNTITFTKGDASTFNITVDTGSGGGSTDTGSLLTTASVSDNTITFTKGDASTFNITVNGGTADALAANGELRGLTTASGHIIPNENDLYDLGTAEKKFRDLYLGSNSIYMSGSGGWMTGSWDGTNFKVNNNALIRSAITGSMNVRSSIQVQTQFADINNPNSPSAPVNFNIACGAASLSTGTVTLTGWQPYLAPLQLGIDCFVTVTAIGGTGLTGPFDVQLAAGNLTISEVGGSNNGDIMYQILYYLP